MVWFPPGVFHTILEYCDDRIEQEQMRLMEKLNHTIRYIVHLSKIQLGLTALHLGDEVSSLLTMVRIWSGAYDMELAIRSTDEGNLSLIDYFGTCD